MASKSHERGFAHLLLVLVLVVAAVVGIGALAYGRIANNSQSKSSLAAATHRNHTITAAAVSTSLDSNGAAQNPASQFQTTDGSLYVVASLKNAPVGTLIAYTRYLNNKLIDNGSVKVAQANANNVSFNFSLKPGQTRPAGNYQVKLYTNGRYERSIRYVVQ